MQTTQGPRSTTTHTGSLLLLRRGPRSTVHHNAHWKPIIVASGNPHRLHQPSQDFPKCEQLLVYVSARQTLSVIWRVYHRHHAQELVS